MKQWMISAVSPNKRNGQFMAIDAPTARAALEEFHDETGDSMVDWTIEVIPADPTSQETRA